MLLIINQIFRLGLTRRRQVSISLRVRRLAHELGMRKAPKNVMHPFSVFCFPPFGTWFVCLSERLRLLSYAGVEKGNIVTPFHFILVFAFIIVLAGAHLWYTGLKEMVYAFFCRGLTRLTRIFRTPALHHRFKKQKKNEHARTYR